MKFSAAILMFTVATTFSVYAHNSSMQMHGSAESDASQEYMAGMTKMNDEMMAAMNESNPDKAFAKGMTAHHEGAITMAETELKYGKDPEMRKLAEDIIEAQKGEIEQMKNWIKNNP